MGLAALLALLLGYAPHHVYGKTGLARLFELRRALADQRLRNAAARLENARARAESAALRSDPRAIERVARDELSLVKPGEIVYEITDGSP